jgi:hypothetical protein
MDKKSPTKREAEPKKTFRVSVHTFRVLNVVSLCLKKFPPFCLVFREVLRLSSDAFASSSSSSLSSRGSKSFSYRLYDKVTTTTTTCL